MTYEDRVAKYARASQVDQDGAIGVLTSRGDLQVDNSLAAVN